MKKLLLSGGVIALFLLYGWHQQQEAGNVQVGTPSQQQPTPTDSLSAPSSQGSSGNDTPPATPTTSQSAGPTNPSASSGQYKNGTYTGSSADAFYGYIQVQATIQGGKLTNVNFLQYPNDRRESLLINQQADPMLAQEAIQAQNANVDIISGATDSSVAFRQSLASALSQAH